MWLQLSQYQKQICYGDAPKWKFLAEAEVKQNETLCRRPNIEHVFSSMYFSKKKFAIA